MGNSPIGYFISLRYLTIKGTKDTVPLRALFYNLSLSLKLLDVLSSHYIDVSTIHVLISDHTCLIFKIVRSGVKCIASLFCYNHLAVCKTHAVVV